MRRASHAQELTPFVNVAQYARDVLALRGLINTVWPGPDRPRLVTNDANPDPRYLQTLLNATLGAVDVATWHLYIAYGLDPKLVEYAWSASEMDKISTTAAGILAGVHGAGFKGEVWVGESAFAWHSGQAGVTNTFLSAPWWLSALGQLSPTHSGFCRQTLIGGHYELIDKTTRSPNPDWYVARLWKDAMGPTAFSVATNDTDLRAYAHCSPQGGLSIAFINFSGNTTAALDVRGQGALGTPRLLRVLASPDNTTVLLNGSPLTYVPGSGALPPLSPASEPADGPLLVAPHTLGFVTWPRAAAFNCKP